MKRRAHRRSRLQVGGPEPLESRTVLTTLAIAEINYAPYEPLPEFGDISEEANDYEFIEVVNFGDQPVDLTGVKFQRVNVAGEEEGVDFEFAPQSLASGERILIVENVEAFQSRYGTALPVAGAWSGGLSSNGEQLTLFDRSGAEIVRMTYDSDGDWPGRANGRGSSIEMIDLTGNPNDPDNWQSSADYGGTPGRGLSDRSQTIIVNEVLAHTDPPQSDAIELYNTTGQPIAMDGWYLSDSLDNLIKFTFPSNSTIDANGYFVITESEFNPGGGTAATDFALSERGDELWLMSRAASGRPGKFVDHAEFEATANGVSVGNVPNGVTQDDFQPLASLTFGRENGGHRVGEVVITEVNYHPPGDDVNLEFIEVRNTFALLDLSGWRMRGGVDVDFPQGTSLGVNETIVLVAFDPTDVTLATNFRNYYGVSDAVRLVGPWDTNSDGESDRLSNDGEKLTLRSPHDDVDEILYVAVDQVDYNDALPWPLVADGDGGSIERSSFGEYGNDPSSWLGVTPNPGNEPIDIASAPELQVGQARPDAIGTDGPFLRGPSDVDLFRFTPTVSGIHQFDVTAAGDLTVDPFVRVFQRDGTELAFNDDSGDTANSQVLVDLQADTEYLVTTSSSGEAGRSYDPLTGHGLVAGATQGAYEIEVSRFTGNETPFQNPELAFDVNGDGFVIPLDALIVINALNSGGSGSLPRTPGDEAPPFLDVSGDNFFSPLDAILVINFLNSAPAEGEPDDTLAATPAKSLASPPISQVESSMTMSASKISVLASAVDAIYRAQISEDTFGERDEDDDEADERKKQRIR